MKKVLLFVMVLVLFFTTTLQKPLVADAVVSKVAQKAAIKVAKEVAKDEAINISYSMVLNYKHRPKPGVEKIKEPDVGFTMICLPENKKDGVCTKPMQVKNTFTPEDKKQLSNTIGNSLDAKTGNKGFLKFVNWFVPVWIVGTAFTVVDLLLDNEITTFFSEMAYDALVKLGFIKPLGLDTTLVTFPKSDNVTTDPDSPDKGTGIPTDWERNWLGVGYSVEPQIPEGINLVNTGLVDFTRMHPRQSSGIDLFELPFKFDKRYLLENKTMNVGSYIIFVYNTWTFDSASKTKQITDMQVFTSTQPYRTAQSVLIEKVDLDSSKLFLNRSHTPGLNQLELNHLTTIAKEHIFDDLIETKPEPMPEVKPQDIPVRPPGTTIKVPSPTSVPVKDKTTGLTVYPKPPTTTGNPIPGTTVENPIYVDKDGKPVPEENVTVEDVVIESTPDGDVVKNPNPSDNPNLEEKPLPKPGETIPPDKPPTDTETPVDPNDPVDGPTCDAQLKMPKIGALFRSMSNAFPFSIPWDLKSGFDAIFLKMGNEKPSFDYELNFKGKKTNFGFEMPAVFDTFIPFVHSVFLFIFDVGILLLIHRLIKGGG